MKIKKLYSLYLKIMYKIFLLFILMSCTQPGKSDHTANHLPDATQSKANATQVKPDLKRKIRENQLASKKDPVCGMPAYKYLKDTIIYKTKIYGFCGKGCKDEFIKNPQRFIR